MSYILIGRVFATPIQIWSLLHVRTANAAMRSSGAARRTAILATRFFVFGEQMPKRDLIKLFNLDKPITERDYDNELLEWWESGAIELAEHYERKAKAVPRRLASRARKFAAEARQIAADIAAFRVEVIGRNEETGGLTL